MDQKTEQALQAAGKHGTVDTVRVKADNEQGFAVINESDFDAKVHEKFEDKPAPKAKK